MKILVADDCLTTRRVLSKNLTDWGYDPVLACDGMEALAMLRHSDAPQLVILDWSMPVIDGLSVCRSIRRTSGQHYVYTIILTAKDTREDLLLALEAEADDFLTKPFDADELKQRIRAGRRVLELQQYLIETQEKLQFQATHDSLTGISNRRAILGALTSELDRARRKNYPTSILLIDFDHFKQVNDSYGHLVGDKVLRETADTMQASIRSYDAIGRFGGEEFIVLLPETNSDEAVVVAERIRRDVCESRIEAEGKKVQITLSVGITTTQEEQYDDHILLNAADKALYLAKRQGRNCVRIAEGDLVTV